MTKSTTCFIGIALAFAAASGAQEISQQEVEKEVEATIERMRTGEKITRTESGLDPCAILRAGIVREVFGVDEASLTFRPASTSHPLCTASWDKPDAAELQASQGQLMMDYMKRRMDAQAKGVPFDEKMPIVRTSNEVSLTINDSTFASPQEAAAALESMVSRLSGGMEVEAMGQKTSVSVHYEGWLEGVGDKAAWAPKLSQLSVAARGVIFHVAARVSEDPAENQAKAVEVANRVAAAL